MKLREGKVTQLLGAWRQGDDGASHAILAEVYEELRRLARGALRGERAGHTLQATALVHEAWLRLGGEPPAGVASRQHLVAIAARLMRQVLVNHALRRRAAKRGGKGRRICLDPALAVFESRCDDLVALDEALDRLSRNDERQARVVELRFFGGLSVHETAVALGTSPRTVEREWTMARAWLRRELTEP